MIKRKVNDRGNGSCQVVIPKKVMEHLNLVAGDEVDFKLIENKDYALLKKVKDLRPIEVSNEEIIKTVKRFVAFLQDNKKTFFRFDMQDEFYSMINTALMILNDNVTLKIIDFLVEELEVTVSSMYGCNIGKEGGEGEEFVNSVYDEYWKVEKALEKYKELKEPKEFAGVIKDLSLILESHYAKSYKVAAIQVIVADSLKEDMGVDFETKVELLNVCTSLLDESGEHGNDIELIRELLEKALELVEEENN